jgi:hypothetical protein
MITIIDFAKRTNLAGENFYALILQGGICMVQSKESGKFYATAKKTSITSTFDELTCKGLVGTKIEGDVVKIPCDPYSFTIEETKEEITLDYRWEYRPATAENEMEKAVFSGHVAVATT